jgi:hypothetical protein
MRLFIALRLLNESQAKTTIEEAVTKKAAIEGTAQPQRGELVDLNITRFHPALRNINEYLRDHDILPEFRRPERARRGRPSSASKQLQATAQGDCRLFWCEVETELTADAWMAVAGVEAVISKDEFSKFVLSIRCKSGAAYIAACEDYARKLPIVRSEPRRSKAA